MPYYDPYSGQEVETPEEEAARKKREAELANQQVGETKIKQYADGSQTHTITKEVPAPVAPEGQGVTAPAGFGAQLGQAVAQMPQNFVNNINRGLTNLQQAPENFARNVAAIPGQVQQRVERAISPDETFNRMMQVESGGRQFTPQGQVVTSNKGAMGIAQVMPTTAMDPGYGVKNIFDLAQERGIPVQNRDLATAKQLLSNRALNQEFGANYYAAMQNRFDGGPAGVAAYNAGPGRVSQNMAANAGQLNVAQLPQETQGYLQKVNMPAQPVKPGVPGLTPVAEMPAQAPNSYDEFGTPVYSQAQADLDTHINRYQTIQNNPDELMKFAFDANTPDYLKQRAKDQIIEGYDRQKKEAEATKAMGNLTPNDIARTLTKKSEGNSVGDWLQYLLFKHVGLNDLANQKGEQLGIGHQWQQAYIQDANGQDVPVEVQTSVSGRVLRGNLAGSDTALTPEQLQQAAGQVMNAGALKTAQTQATHAYTTAYTSLMKQRDALVQRGAGEQEMAARGLDMASIQTRANEAGQNVLNAARKNYRGAAAGTVPGAQPAATAGTTNVTSTGTTAPAKPVRVLDNWTGFRPGETTANYDKRQQYTPDDIETEARQLVAGDKTIKDITGRDAGLLRHYASARAKELDSTWSATDADARRDALKKWTNPDSNVAKQVRSHITASNSIQDVKQAFEALQNGNTPLFNEIRNTFRTNTGNDLPINAKTGAMLLGPEIIKSIIPGGGGVTERLEAQHLMGVNLSPDQQKAVFKILEDFQGNSLKALETDWTRARLPKDQFRERVLGGSPAAQELYDTASAHQAQQAARRAGLTNVPTPAEVQAEIKRRQGSK